MHQFDRRLLIYGNTIVLGLVNQRSWYPNMARWNLGLAVQGAWFSWYLLLGKTIPHMRLCCYRFLNLFLPKQDNTDTETQEVTWCGSVRKRNIAKEQEQKKTNKEDSRYRLVFHLNYFPIKVSWKARSWNGVPQRRIANNESVTIQFTVRSS